MTPETLKLAREQFEQAFGGIMFLAHYGELSGYTYQHEKTREAWAIWKQATEIVARDCAEIAKYRKFEKVDNTEARAVAEDIETAIRRKYGVNAE